MLPNDRTTFTTLVRGLAIFLHSHRGGMRAAAIDVGVLQKGGGGGGRGSYPFSFYEALKEWGED